MGDQFFLKKEHKGSLVTFFRNSLKDFYLILLPYI